MQNHENSMLQRIEYILFLPTNLISFPLQTDKKASRYWHTFIFLNESWLFKNPNNICSIELYTLNHTIAFFQLNIMLPILSKWCIVDKHFLLAQTVNWNNLLKFSSRSGYICHSTLSSCLLLLHNLNYQCQPENP